MSVTTKDEIQEQLRILNGERQWAFWSMRVERLNELVEMMESWNEREEVVATCPTAPLVLAGLRDMLGAAVPKLESLAEFAPKTKGRKERR